MDQKNIIVKKLKAIKEAKVMIKPEDFQSIAPELGDDDVVKIVDEDGNDSTRLRIIDVIEDLVDKNIEPTINNVVIASLYTSGGTLAGHESEIEDVLSSVLGEVNQDVMSKFKDQYGKEQGEKVYHATANKQNRNPENFHTENKGKINKTEKVNAKMKKSDLVENILKIKK